VEGLTKILKTVVVAAELSEIQTTILPNTSLTRHRCSSQFGCVVMHCPMSGILPIIDNSPWSFVWFSSPRVPGFVARPVPVGFCGGQSSTVSGFISDPREFLLSASSLQSTLPIYSCITEAN
jgi:hypothetical protein